MKQRLDEPRMPGAAYLLAATMALLLFSLMNACASNSRRGAATDSTSVSPTPEPGFTPPPMAGPPKTLHSRAVAEKTGIVLTAPPQNASPKIPAEVALATAWEEEGSEGEAKSAQLTYALLTSGIYAKTPVWLVTYYGTCVPAPGNEQRCAKINFHTLINADTDKFIGSFVDRSLHI